MLYFFQYNWMVREEWFEWCKKLSAEEVAKERTGGMNSILHTLFHIVDVEQSWTGDLTGRTEIFYEYKDFGSLDRVIEFSNMCRAETEEIVRSWTPEIDLKLVTGINSSGQPFEYKFGEIMRHMIAHEIHHVGQLSVWAREIGLEPVHANLIGKGLF
ncbi:DinB family protein [Bacillus sp. T33-2]|uniref:DinB family protein n=1 Tax=Bacillus sp. T33-2 TaxID=2054168 RepID=UPI000C760A6F|nr:DinB family protein [Bacillus sp. T33-2]PLR94188.1 damage-inducible protein DinB [Bacillus sp. T33-2]